MCKQNALVKIKSELSLITVILTYNLFVIASQHLQLMK